MARLDEVMKDILDKAKETWRQVLRSQIAEDVLARLGEILEVHQDLAIALDELLEVSTEHKLTGLSFRILLSTGTAHHLESQLNGIIEWAESVKANG